jgi:hypothetical protein
MEEPNPDGRSHLVAAPKEESIVAEGCWKIQWNPADRLGEVHREWDIERPLSRDCGEVV